MVLKVKRSPIFSERGGLGYFLQSFLALASNQNKLSFYDGTHELAEII